MYNVCPLEFVVYTYLLFYTVHTIWKGPLNVMVSFHVSNMEVLSSHPKDVNCGKMFILCIYSSFLFI